MKESEWGGLVSDLLYMHDNGLTEEDAIAELGYDPDSRARMWLAGPVVTEQEVTEPSKPMKVNWVCHENPVQDMDLDLMHRTDEADKYRHSQGEIAEMTDNRVWTCIPILKFLWGRPWNNAALNYVLGMNPNRIRVRNEKESITCDACSSRVTVWLSREDDRTITHIEQELQFGGIGCRYGDDLRLHWSKFKDKPMLERSDFPPPDDGSGRAYINMEAAKKLDLYRGKW